MSTMPGFSRSRRRRGPRRGLPTPLLLLGAVALIIWVATDGATTWPWTTPATEDPTRSAVVTTTGDGAEREPGRADEAPSVAVGREAIRDLSQDEARGGHTLARHVGLTEAALVARLGREPNISAASTFADRDTAERVVGAAITAEHARIARWHEGDARGANLVVRYRGARGSPIGIVVRRGGRQAVDAFDARVVLRWDEGRGDFFVLTAYPDDPR